MVWLLAFRLFVGGIVTIYVPHSILSSHPERSLSLPSALAVIGGLVMAAVGTAIYVRCVWDFAFDGHGMAPKVLVARGTYKLLGEALFFRSWRLSGYAAACWVCLHLLVTLYEEPTLAREFGRSYAQYRKAVPRWIPTHYGSRSS